MHTSQHLTNHQRNAITEAFGEIDKNSDGRISLEELIEYLTRDTNDGWTRERIRRAFELADSDQSGHIDLSEFTVLMSRSMPQYGKVPEDH